MEKQGLNCNEMKDVRENIFKKANVEQKEHLLFDLQQDLNNIWRERINKKVN